MQSLVTHLHAFIDEVELSEEEWLAGIGFLTEAGQLTNEERQEFVLLSDVLGASMLVIGQSHPVTESATESTVFGPFFVNGSPRFETGGDLSNGALGEPCHVSGRVTGTDGLPIAHARVDVWQADEAGKYDVQYDDGVVRGRGHLYSDRDGSFSFRTVRPTAYPIPTDGPVGRLMEATNRSAMRPAHIHFRITAAGYEPLTTHLFAAGDEFLDTDAVFGVKQSLVVPFTKADSGWVVHHEFVLQRVD